jgi:putative FmdB family regulatory protein
MPIYTYTCKKCGFVFEELVSYEKRDSGIPCTLCKEESERKAAEEFGIKTTLNPNTDTVYSAKEIDKVVGQKSEEKWEGYDARWKQRYKDRQEKRWKGAAPAPVNIPKDQDGKYTPLMHLGDSKQRSLRNEFSEALQTHREERKKKGLTQFDGPGAISEE